MTNRELSRQLAMLQGLFDKARDMAHDIELQGHWGRYLCVLAAGFLENAIRELYTERARSSASPDVASFVSLTLGRVQNPKAQRFLEITKAFDNQWAQELEAYLAEDDGHRRNAIDSIMNNRHLIAHGRSAAISVARVREYLQASVEVVEFMETKTA